MMAMPFPTLRTSMARYTTPSSIGDPPPGPALEDHPGGGRGKHDLLWRIFEAGRRKNRTEADFKGALGDTVPDRLAERTAEKVATASTSVPPAVASEEIVVQLVTGRA